MKRILSVCTLLSLCCFLLMACHEQPGENTLAQTPHSMCGSGERNSVVPALQLIQLEPSVTFQLRSMLTDTRETLVRRGANALRQVVTELRSQVGDYCSLNKAEIYTQGLERAELAIANSIRDNRVLHQEQISILTSGGIQNSHELEFTQSNELSIAYSSEWMDYFNVARAQELMAQGFQMTFANFANARLGGGWRRHGNVQEEQMAQQCPEFAVILASFNHDPNHIQLYTRKQSSEVRHDMRFAGLNTADPKLITNLRCFQSLNPRYRHAIGSIMTNLWNFGAALQDEPHAPLMNMIAMAAPELRSFERGRAYSLILLRDLFNNAYTAFSMVKLNDQQNHRHSYLTIGRWGAGAFGHAVNMSIAIQYLAASFVFNQDDRILFTGLTEAEVQPAVTRVREAIAAQSPSTLIVIDQILNRLLLDVGQDADWFTR